MFTSTIEILIHRPIDEVFAHVADARNRPQWDDSVISAELTSPEPIGVATTVRTRLRSTGRAHTYTWEVTEHRPPHRMTITSTQRNLDRTFGRLEELLESGTAIPGNGRWPPAATARLLPTQAGATRSRS